MDASDELEAALEDARTESIGRMAIFLDDFENAVWETFRAYDDMARDERKRLIGLIGRMDFRRALDLVLGHASFRKAAEECPVVRTPIVDEETGRSFVTVEGGADPDMQEHFRNMTMEESNK